MGGEGQVCQFGWAGRLSACMAMSGSASFEQLAGCLLMVTGNAAIGICLFRHSSMGRFYKLALTDCETFF